MRFAGLSKLLLVTGLAFPLTSIWAAPAQTGRAASTLPRSAVATSGVVATKLQNAIAESQKQLGTLQPWEEKIFLEEVVPQYQRFIRDYRAVGAGLNVDVDIEGIKAYLKFYAPKALKRENAPLLIALKPDASCVPCTAALEGVKKLAGERMVRRGFVPVFLTSEELARVTDDEKLVQAVAQRQAVGSLLIAWGNAPVEDEAHADEGKFLVRSVLSLRDIPRSEGRMEIFPTESFERPVRLLLTDFLNELGTRSFDRARDSAIEEEKDGYAVEVSGIREFAQYQALKNAVFALVPDGMSIDERKVSRGKVVFSVLTAKPIEEVKVHFSTVKMEKGKLVSTGSDAQSIQMEIRP